MTDGIQGIFSYPGISSQGWSNFTFHDLAGISPSVGLLTIFPQYGTPDLDGDVVLTYGSNTITIKNAHIDRVDYKAGSGGKEATVRFLDERWKWAYYEITGRYNFRLPNNFPDPDHEKSPQELATLCFQAMKVKDFDVSVLPNDARPEVDWDHANPAQELARICDDLGCKIVPQRTTGKWVIVVVGEGADLPDGGLPYNDYGAGIDPKETPDYLKIVSAPISYQVALELEHIGKDIDQSWNNLKKLSYALNTTETGYGFSRDIWQQSGIDPERIRQVDGSVISPQELAVQTVLKSFRISDTPGNASNSTDKKGNNTFKLPGYADYVTRKQLIPINQLVETYTDVYGGEHKRASLMFGEWWGDLGEGPFGNHYPGTRLDYQEASLNKPEERASFTMSVDEIDADKTIITTSKPMVKYIKNTTSSGDEYIFSPATMYLVCTVNVRDPVTWQPIRAEQLLQIGSGNDKSFCHTVIKNDIQPWFIQNYDNYGKPSGTVRENKDEVQKQLDYYVKQIANTFETVASETKRYFLLLPMDLDGAIAQVTWIISNGDKGQGCDTIVSRGTEHNFDIPTYEQRLHRDFNKNVAGKIKFSVETIERKTKLLGFNNT